MRLYLIGVKSCLLIAISDRAPMYVLNVVPLLLGPKVSLSGVCQPSLSRLSPFSLLLRRGAQGVRRPIEQGFPNFSGYASLCLPLYHVIFDNLAYLELKKVLKK